MVSTDGGIRREVQLQETQKSLPYESSNLNIYCDMGALLVLAPPV